MVDCRITRSIGTNNCTLSFAFLPNIVSSHPLPSPFIYSSLNCHFYSFYSHSLYSQQHQNNIRQQFYQYKSRCTVPIVRTCTASISPVTCSSNPLTYVIAPTVSPGFVLFGYAHSFNSSYSTCYEFDGI
jgi:hypothetical protein